MTTALHVFPQRFPGPRHRPLPGDSPTVIPLTTVSSAFPTVMPLGTVVSHSRAPMPLITAVSDSPAAIPLTTALSDLASTDYRGTV